ncbi:MAG TPA: dTMP kinase [Myxococcota bacterium]|nr:dTMP kinase [Myxococcota bacterium]HQK49648.1 dTMP kinase [Myxococcota bacterium]
MTPSQGRFLVLEGIDGAGTTTQLRALAEGIAQQRPDLRVHLTAEPSSGPVGQCIRQILRGRITGQDVLGRPGSFDPASLALLFAADRMDHLATEVLPLVREGWVVISDRYLWSSLAYQSLKTPWSLIQQANSLAPDPDLMVMIHVPPEVAMSRLEGSRPGFDVFENLATLREVEQAYRQALEVRPPGHLLEVDGTLPIGEVARRILDAVLPLLG